MRGYAWLCVGVRGCEWVYAGVNWCAWVWVGVLRIHSLLIGGSELLES